MTDWQDVLQEVGTLWHHDGHPDRPYALLTSGKISGDFVDTSFAMAKPIVIAAAARQLAEKVTLLYGPVPKKTLVICGQQEGSTTLASRIAEELGCGFVYTTKVGEGADKEMVLAERFEGIFPEGCHVVLVEDVSTTTGTSAKSRAALVNAGFKPFRNLLLTLVDRTGGKNEFGFEVVSCLKLNDLLMWNNGENPHTESGQELVPPVRAKTKAGRKEMRKTRQ
jgi:orotate phosphoribosyltransferase